MSQSNQSPIRSGREQSKPLAWVSLLLGFGAIGLLSVPTVGASPLPEGVIAQTSPSGSNTRPADNPPLPEQLQSPSAIVQPVNGRVSIRLVNTTGTDITYQVIGVTEQRKLAGRSNVTLQDLNAPINIAFYRPDRGFLLVQPQTLSNNPGTLEVTLTETENFSIDKTTMVINAKGEVYLN